MSLFTVTISPSPLAQKPNSESLFLSHRSELIESAVSEITLEDFARRVGQEGHSYLACNHNGSKFCNNSAINFCFLSLDFEPKNESILPFEVLEILKNEGLDATFIYTTFGDTNVSNDPLKQVLRFRVVIALDRITEISEIGGIEGFKGFFKNVFEPLFPTMDRNCKDPARFFYGSKSLIYENYDYRLNVDFLLYKSAMFHSFGSANFKKQKKELIARHSIKYAEQPTIKKTKIRWSEEDWMFARSEWPLLDDFFSGRGKLFHDSLYMLYFSFSSISGGVKKWIECVEKHPNIDEIEKVKKIHDWVKISIDKGMVPFEPPISRIDPTLPPFFYYKMSEIGKRSKQMKPYKAQNFSIVERSLDEVRIDLESSIKAKFKTGSTYIKAPTGVGKTHALIQLLKEEENRNGTLLAVPTHQLKYEIAKKLIENGIPFEMTPEEPGLPKYLNSEISRLRKNGFGEEAISLLHLIARGQKKTIKNYSIDPEYIFSLREYFEAIKDAKESAGLVLTTHSMLFNSEFPNHANLIIDEDPTFRCLSVFEVPLKDLEAILHPGELTEYIDNLRSIRRDALNKTGHILLPPLPRIKKKQLKGLQIKDVGNLVDAEKLLLKRDKNGKESIVFSTHKKLKTDYKSLMILSATAYQNILSKIFPKLEYIDLGFVELKGKLVQNLNRSLSKTTAIREGQIEVLSELSTQIGNTKVISHKLEELDSLFNGGLNFYNSEGLNTFQDYDLLILGTPYPPEHLLPLVFLTLGIEFEIYELDWMQVEINGWIIPLRTYKDSCLRSAHIKFIEGILLQAVGRARLIQYNRKVMVISKMPLPQAEVIDSSFVDLPSYTLNELHLTGSLDFGKNLEVDKEKNESYIYKRIDH